MVILITGATHTGKTLLAQRLLEKHRYPYLSIDHLKMGLIRSGSTHLKPTSPVQELENLLWPIVREITKTAIENHQNLIVEGCYIPYGYRNDFGAEYLPHIKALWLIFSEDYLHKHFEDLAKFESAIEHRATTHDYSKAALIETSRRDLKACNQHNLPHILIDGEYNIGIDEL